MKKIDIAFMAGFFEGEGCISICRYLDKGNRKQMYLRVAISQTNEWIINWFQWNFGGSVNKMGRKPQEKQRWQLAITGKKALCFLEVVLPYLKLKRAEAELGIEFQKRKRGSGHYLKVADSVLQEADRVRMAHLKNRPIIS